MPRGGLGRRARHRRSPVAPSARAAGTGSARGRAGSRVWPGTAAGQDELTPLPAEGPRAAAPEDGAAAPGPVGAALGWATAALTTLTWPPQRPAGPGSLRQSRQPWVSGSVPSEPFSQPRRSSPPSPSYRSPRSHVLPSPKTQARAFLERLRKRGTATCQPRPQPVLGTPAQHHHAPRPRATPGTGRPRPAAR